jgi:hypothetical protein
MWIMLPMGSCWLYTRPGGATREKWRIPDGKECEWSIFIFRAPKVVPPTTNIDYVLTHLGYMGPHKFISFNDHRVG